VFQGIVIGGLFFGVLGRRPRPVTRRGCAAKPIDPIATSAPSFISHLSMAGASRPGAPCASIMITLRSGGGGSVGRIWHDRR
jgi:hypothetical protein